MKSLRVMAGFLALLTAAGCTAPAPEPVAPTTSGAGGSTGPLAAKLLTEADVLPGTKVLRCPASAPTSPRSTAARLWPSSHRRPIRQKPAPPSPEAPSAAS